MKIARFLINGTPVIAIDKGQGFFDYTTILEMQGYCLDVIGSDPEKRMIKLVRRGLLEEKFIESNYDWARTSGKLRVLNTDNLTPLLPMRPGKIVCIARNWAGHAKEGGHNLPDNPVFFAKTENCAIGTSVPIPLYTELGQIDYEGELGVVISRKASCISREEFANYILGYLIVNDVTARELQKKNSAKGLPWYQTKSCDGSAPMGPWIVTPNELGNIDDKRIQVFVNDQLKQEGCFGEMHWKIPELMEVITRYVTLLPGDVIALGTPAGVGPLSDGDIVSITIKGIGTLCNPVKKA